MGYSIYTMHIYYMIIMHTDQIVRLCCHKAFIVAIPSLSVFDGFPTEEGTREFLFALPRFASDEVRD